MDPFMARVAVVILTHFFNDHIRQLFERLTSEAPEGYQVFININCGANSLDMPKAALPHADHIHLCNFRQIMALPYPAKVDPAGWNGLGWKMPGHEDTNMLCFYKNYPDFDYYWGIEYDVHFEGHWSFLFRHFEQSRADILATALYNAAETPKKILNPLVRNPEGDIPEPEFLVRGFYPLFRASNRFLAAVDAAYRMGWTGHYEVAWGTLAKSMGYEIEDIGGTGAYVKPHNRNAFYFNTPATPSMSPGTFVFRPSFLFPHKQENTLWHPIKPDGVFNWHVSNAEKPFPKNLVHAIKPYLWQAVIWLWFIFCRRAPRKPDRIRQG
ncbi:hypothetical protein EYF88_13205 [Paracoccus sediminis]|uniref:Rhamnan synthesis protein F n=2 Tax=Paracoccus sediminis TaxID=1214787 RepID=A0ABY1YJT1_9RHOB|nr:hypothetical protein EYF88_13205 [Paracoccus sediminis]